MNMKDGYYWITVSPVSKPQIVDVQTGTAWGRTPSTERRQFVMFMGLADRVLLSEFDATFPGAKWGARIAEPSPGQDPCGRCGGYGAETDGTPCNLCDGSGLAGKREPLGTPISELSGRPGHKGYEEFCRIAESWGH